MVQHNKMPFNAAPTANGIPLMISHKRFASMEIVPPPYRISFPNGKNAKEANLKHCVPIGIPTMVIHHRIPAIVQPSPCHNPPHKNHMIFPKHPIIILLLSSTLQIIRYSVYAHGILLKRPHPLRSQHRYNGWNHNQWPILYPLPSLQSPVHDISN